MATPPSLTSSVPRAEAEPLVEAPPISAPVPKAQPLWRFALVGLGPLAALAIFGLLLAFFQHLS
jgi:hypothetical protein